MRSLIALLSLLALGYAAIVGLMFVMQPRLLYLRDFGGREPTVTPAQIGLVFEDVLVRAADGAVVHGWFVPHSGARHTLIYFHGNAGNIGHRLESIRRWHTAGVAVLIFDYHGYGRSEGRPSEAATYQDALAVWDYLTETRGVRAAEIVLFGRSLGGAVATWLATQRAPAALIVDSGFTSVPDLAAEIYPWLPTRWLARFRYDARENIARVRCSVLVAHSPEDEIIPFHHGQALYEAAPEPKRFLQTSGGHNDGHLLAVPQYRAQLNAFLENL